jgi:hypothetical protein
MQEEERLIMHAKRREKIECALKRRNSAPIISLSQHSTVNRKRMPEEANKFPREERERERERAGRNASK